MKRAIYALLLSLNACGGQTSQPARSPRSPSAAPPIDDALAIATKDGLVKVQHPGEGWTCAEDHAEAGNVVASWIRCAQPSGFYLMAKDYSVSPSEVAPAEQLFRRYYENNYRRMFGDFEYVSERALDAGVEGGSAFEIVLSARGDVRLRERATVVGVHVLLLTAAGPRAEVEAESKVVEAWFSGTRFESIERERARGQAFLRAASAPPAC
jgi:hypothetical protein